MAVKINILFLVIICGICVLNALPAKDKSCDCVCGVRGRGSRIVGGGPEKAHEYPWLVGLFRQGSIYCGAAIISAKHVLTAAHCVNNFEPSEIRIYIGGHNITSDYTDIRRIKEVYKHEYYEVDTFNNDIAVIEMDKPVTFGPKVQPSCLPKEQFQEYAGKYTLVAGWGRTGEKERTSKGLRSLIVPVWSREQCAESDYGKNRITDNMMCAGYPEGAKDSCFGDSGGPMQYEGATGSMEIIGIVSWGRGCARPNLPGLYTRVSNYLPWIQKKLKGQCLCPPKTGQRTNFIEKMVNAKTLAV